jgi:hypothetical protein
MPSKRRETPIERIFHEVMGRKMTPAIQAILLHKSSTKSGRSECAGLSRQQSQWEKESRVAEARLSSGKKKDTRTIGKRKNPTL